MIFYFLIKRKKQIVRVVYTLVVCIVIYWALRFNKKESEPLDCSLEGQDFFRGESVRWRPHWDPDIHIESDPIIWNTPHWAPTNIELHR